MVRPLDIIGNKLLNMIQVELPLTPAPYHALGGKMGIEACDVIQRIEELKTEGIIRQISPVLDARRLGYRSTLVAMKIAPPQLKPAAQLIVEHPGVSHGYERDHQFNLWFTLAIPPTIEVENELKRLNSLIGAEAAFALPAIKLFKIMAHFAVDEDLPLAAVGTQSNGALPQEAELSDLDRLVINELQQDLPLIPRPFDAMAKGLGMSVADFLSQCRSLLERGIIRRFSASVNHRKVGFTANAMTCWVTPPEMVDGAGQKLASLAEVSHCYERKTNTLWPYNLFAMIHGHTKETCHEIAARVSQETGLSEHVLLFSTKEFKKTRIKYLV